MWPLRGCEEDHSKCAGGDFPSSPDSWEPHSQALQQDPCPALGCQHKASHGPGKHCLPLLANKAQSVFDNFIPSWEQLFSGHEKTKKQKTHNKQKIPPPLLHTQKTPPHTKTKTLQDLLWDPYWVPPGPHLSSVSLSKFRPSGISLAHGDPNTRRAHLATWAPWHNSPMSAASQNPEGPSADFPGI